MAFLIRFFFILIMLLLIEISSWAHADDGLQLHEQEIEAGLIYNFLKYIEWPTNSKHGTAVSVCIFGDDPFKGYLQPLAGRTVNQRTIAVRTVRDMPGTVACDLLFINAAEKEVWPQLEKYVSGKNILTVSNLNDFANSGGMIEFGRQDDHIHVSLNLDAVTAARLRVQDRLLKLVTVMRAPNQER